MNTSKNSFSRMHPLSFGVPVPPSREGWGEVHKQIILTACICLLSIAATAQTIIFQENFNAAAALPVGWTIDSAGQIPVTAWKFTGPPNNVTGSGFSGYYPRIYGLINKPVECNLVTTNFDASLHNSCFLSFAEQFAGQNGNSFYATQKIEVSNNGGLSWNTVSEHSRGKLTQRTIVDITNYAAGYTNVKVRFHFLSNLSSWWALDSIVIADSINCISPPDSGFTVTNKNFVCTGSPAKLWIEALSRGLGQTYQWQLRNAATGNLWSNVSGATTDTLNITQNGSTYYHCTITCAGLINESDSCFLIDTPSICEVEPFINITGLCSGKDDTMHLTKSYAGTGVNYQWLYSPVPLGFPYNPNANYIPIAGATDSTYIASYTNYMQETYFACRLICPSNNASKLGYEKIEWANVHPLCYCIPFNNNFCNNGSRYTYVGIPGTTLSHTFACVDTIYSIYGQTINNYQYFNPSIDSATAVLKPGNSYNIELSRNNNLYKSALWIDYNHDIYFAANEFTYLGPTNVNGQVYSFPFTVPANALTGLTGMRLRGFTYFQPIDSNMSCQDVAGGSTHDYMVMLDSTVSVLNIDDGILNIAVLPNPSKGETTITSPLPIKSLKVLTVTGSVVFSRDKINDFKVVVDVKELADGIYFVQVLTDKGYLVRKLVKQ